MTIQAGEPVQVRKAANGYIVTPALGDEFVSDAQTLVFNWADEVTDWLIDHFADRQLDGLTAQPLRRWWRWW